MCTAGLPHRISSGEATIVIIVNLFAPGVGTIVAGCIGTHGGTAICVGLLQLLLFPVLIGWIWALIWGLALHKQAAHDKHGTREVDVEQGTRTEATSSKGHSHQPESGHHDIPHEKVTKPAPVHESVVQHGTPAQEFIPPPPNPHMSYPPEVPPPPPSAPPLYR
ncbi:unnamed protein product [Agarophyton chilense]